MTLQRVPVPSPNYSSRGGAGVRLICIHTAEGAATYQALGRYFQNTNAQVSSHVGIDDTPNTVGEYVQRSGKAWTAANANPVAVQAELCAWANWSTAQWMTHQTMLANLAQWVREEAAAFNIPIVGLTPAQAQGNGRGVCQHRDLGSWGGGHVDCGPNFPMDYVLGMAAGGPPIPDAVLAFASGQEDANVALTTGPDGSRVDMVFVATGGAVHHWWAPDPGALTDPNRRGGEILGGQVRPGGGVSGGWTADKRYFVVCCEGTDNRPYLNWTVGDGKWSDWHPVGDSGMLRTPA